jgi:hypothetical protein
MSGAGEYGHSAISDELIVAAGRVDGMTVRSFQIVGQIEPANSGDQ